MYTVLRMFPGAGTARPIPRRALAAENEAELSAFVFGEGELVFLENAHGSPGAAVGRDSRTASREHSAGDCSFPINASSVRYKGLAAAAASITSEDECAAACCAVGSAAHCNVYQFYEVKAAGQASQCWIGLPTHAEGSPPQGFRSRARVKPPVGPTPAPPGPLPPSGATTVQWNGRSYALPAYSVTIVDRSGAVLYQTHNTSAVTATQRVFRPGTALPLEWLCWSELSLIAERSLATDAVRSATPLEQLNLTRDRTEYLLYVTTLPVQLRQTAKSLRLEGRIANAYAAFVDGALLGQAFNAAHGYGSKTYDIALAQDSVDGPTASAGGSRGTDHAGSTTRELAILSTSLGMHSHVTSRALDFKGVVGAVTLDGATLSSWRHVIGLAGEH